MGEDGRHDEPSQSLDPSERREVRQRRSGSHPTSAKSVKLFRLWSLVFLANMAGTLAVGWLIDRRLVVDAEAHEAISAISRDLLRNGFWPIFCLAIPAGFLIGSLCWILPNAKGFGDRRSWRSAISVHPVI